MSIATKTGDNGTTGLLFNRRVPKDHPRVETYGTCDELNAAIGMARSWMTQSPASPTKKWIHDHLFSIQKKLVDLMAELATLPEDRERYLKAGHKLVSDDDVEHLTKLVHELEAQGIHFEGWATPGNFPGSGALDVARTTCRRAERRVTTLNSSEKVPHITALKYLNRLADLLWIMARKADAEKI